MNAKIGTFIYLPCNHLKQFVTLRRRGPFGTTGS
jgi:hypothetical protein